MKKTKKFLRYVTILYIKTILEKFTRIENRIVGIAFSNVYFFGRFIKTNKDFNYVFLQMWLQDFL